MVKFTLANLIAFMICILCQIVNRCSCLLQDIIDSDLPTAVLLLNSLTEQVCNVIEPEYFDLDEQNHN